MNSRKDSARVPEFHSPATVISVGPAFVSVRSYMRSDNNPISALKPS